MSGSTANGPGIITLHSYPRAIIHVDCDSFFASCESARDPSLKGKPLVTGKERGIISSASYEAKRLGIGRGVSLSEAKRICPDLIILPSDYETYSIYSERLFTILKSFTPDVEPFSIDEAFCDITGLRRLHHGSYAAISRAIKDRVLDELDITISIGLSITKTLAKICSKENKPNGLTELPGYKIHEFLKGMPLERVCGFGPNTVELLTKHGITDVLGYIKRPLWFCQRLLGKIGVELWHELKGESVYKVNPDKREKHLTISKSKTFMPVSSDKDVVKGHLMRNLESALIKLRRHKLSAAGLVVYLRSDDFRGSGSEIRLNRHSAAVHDFAGPCADIFDEVFRFGTTYRATGVVLFNIIPEAASEGDLFDDPVRVIDTRAISKAIDEANAKYGKHTLHLGVSDIVSRKPPHSRNDIAERKKSLIKGETFRRRIGLPVLKMAKV